jgi:hypothetical protein
MNIQQARVAMGVDATRTYMAWTLGSLHQIESVAMFSLLLPFDSRGVFDGSSYILHGYWPKSNQCLSTRKFAPSTHRVGISSVVADYISDARYHLAFFFKSLTFVAMVTWYTEGFVGHGPMAVAKMTRAVAVQ